jgi:hypothetical protein
MATGNLLLPSQTSCSTLVWGEDPFGGNSLSFVAMFTTLHCMYNHWLNGMVKASLASFQNSSKLAAYLGLVVVPAVDLKGIMSWA